MWIAAQKRGSLSVADFGGSLGSSYFQNRLYLDQLTSVKWWVIEQPHFVQCGNQYFSNDRLRFFESLDLCIDYGGIPDVLLLSCVLPYLEYPYEMLARMCQKRIPYILIDNTYFNYENRDRICIQIVPQDIYEASYPCWLLCRSHVIECLQSKYKILSEHKNDAVIYVDGKKINYEGFLASSIE